MPTKRKDQAVTNKIIAEKFSKLHRKIDRLRNTEFSDLDFEELKSLKEIQATIQRMIEVRTGVFQKEKEKSQSASDVQ